MSTRHRSSTGVEDDVDLAKALQIRVFSSPLSTRCRPRDTLVCSPSFDGARSGATRVERSIELTAETLWSDVSSRLKGALNETTYQTWFAEAEGSELSDDAFVLAVPNGFTREW